MLAYVFWHAPAAGADAARYEEVQSTFHGALNTLEPRACLSSWSYRVTPTPWLASGGYEDWYLVEGSASLDPLAEAAVGAALRMAHDAAAASARGGVAGLYRWVRGPQGPGQPNVVWCNRSPGVGYDRFEAALGHGAGLWQRHLVLGPTPEFMVDSVPAGGVACDLVPVRRALSTPPPPGGSA